MMSFYNPHLRAVCRCCCPNTCKNCLNCSICGGEKEICDTQRSFIPSDSKEDTVSLNRKELKFLKTHQSALDPPKASPLSAGFDLKSLHAYTVTPRNSELIETGIAIQLPEGCYGRIAPRSGLSLHHKIDVLAGVIDQDYRGSIKVILFNHSDVEFRISYGDRIAQLICEKMYYPELREVNKLSNSERELKGFGSSGK